MLRSFSVSLFILISFSVAHATRVSDVLKTAWQDPSLSSYEDAVSEMQRASSTLFRQVDLGYERDIELKTDGVPTNEFFLKFEPKSWKEYQAENSVTAESLQFLKKVRLAQVLVDRYQLAIDYLVLNRKLKILENITETAQKNLETQLMASRLGRADLRKVLKARLESSRFQRELKDTIALLTMTKAKLSALTVKFSEKEFGQDLISFGQISQKIDEAKNIQSVSARVKEIELKSLSNEHSILLGRRNALIRSFGLSYLQNEKVSPEKELRLTVSFSLPFLSGDTTSAAKQQDLVLKQVSMTKEISYFRSQEQLVPQTLKTALKEYEQLSLLVNTSDLGKKNLSNDPQINVETRLEIYRAKIELLDAEKEILSLYLQFLFERGTLLSQPDVNHLSRNEVTF